MPRYERLESVLHCTGLGGEQNRLVSAMPLYSIISDNFSFSGKLLRLPVSCKFYGEASSALFVRSEIYFDEFQFCH
jgi:hypothetical protein